MTEGNFTVVERVEQSLDIVPPHQSEAEPAIEVVNAQRRASLFQFADQLAQPELCWRERGTIAAQLLYLFGFETEHLPHESRVS